MAHTLMQNGNNSLTYSFEVVDGGINFLRASDWEALPNSRIKTFLSRTYDSFPVPDQYPAFIEYAAREGLSVTANVIVGAPGPQAGIALMGSGDGPVLIGYSTNEGFSIGNKGVLRISLAYSASE